MNDIGRSLHQNHAHSNDSDRERHPGPQRLSSDLLTIPSDQVPTSWLSSFKSAQIKLIVPFDNPESRDCIPPINGPDHHQTDSYRSLPSRLAELAKTPCRESVYLGEKLKVYVILSLDEPNTAELESHHNIENHLKSHLSIHLEANLTHDSTPSLSTRSTTIYPDPNILASTATGRSNKSKKLSPLSHSSPLSPIASTSITHSKGPTISVPLKAARLFTASYWGPKFVNPHACDSVSSNLAQENLSQKFVSEVSNQLKIQVLKLGDQWSVIWEAHSEIVAHVQGTTPVGSLSLSSVISYHSIHPENSTPLPSFLPTRPLSDSPPKFHDQQRPLHAGSDYGFEKAIEVDLFDGMGRGHYHVENSQILFLSIVYWMDWNDMLILRLRYFFISRGLLVISFIDLSIFLPRPSPRSAGSVPAHQSVTTLRAGQSNRASPSGNRLSHSNVMFKAPHGLLHSSRSEEHLSYVSEERSQSAPTLPATSVKRSTSYGCQKEFSPNLPNCFDINPKTSGSPVIEKRCSAIIPILDPIMLKIETIVPQNCLNSRAPITQPFNNLGIRFVKVNKALNPMIAVELSCSQGLTCLDDFLLEHVDIQLEEQGLVPEFDDFVSSSIKILPVLSPASDRNFPCLILPHDVHRLIYSIDMAPARLLPAQGKEYLPSASNHDHHPIHLRLPPPMSISNITSAFQHQKSGILSIGDVHSIAGHEFSLNSTLLDRANASDSSPRLGNPHINRGTAQGNGHVCDYETPSRNQSQQPSGPSYLLTVQIRGKVISSLSTAPNHARSTDLISAVWTGILSHIELSSSASLELSRQSSHGDNSDINSAAWNGETGLRQLVTKANVNDLSPGFHPSEVKNLSCGLVAGSKRHSASNLILTLKGLSRFQMMNDSREPEQSRTKNQLSPLLINSDAKPLRKSHDTDASTFLISPTSASSSVFDSGRRFFTTPRPWTAINSSTSISTKTLSVETEPVILGSKTNSVKPTANGSNQLIPPIPTIYRALPEKKQNQPLKKGSSSSSDFGEMVVHVKLSSSINHHQKNRFQCLEEFSIEILVFNRSVIHRPLQGPFQFKIVTNPHNLFEYAPHSAAFRPFPVFPGHRSEFNPCLPGQLDGGIISIDEFISIGPLAIGECQTGKIRLVGLKPGIFQLDGIQIIRSEQYGNSHPPQAFLVDPLVILIQ